MNRLHIDSPGLDTISLASQPHEIQIVQITAPGTVAFRPRSSSITAATLAVIDLPGLAVVHTGLRAGQVHNH